MKARLTALYAAVLLLRCCWRRRLGGVVVVVFLQSKAAVVLSLDDFGGRCTSNTAAYYLINFINRGLILLKIVFCKCYVPKCLEFHFLLKLIFNNVNEHFNIVFMLIIEKRLEGPMNVLNKNFYL